jgi:hypothetical protein
MGGFHGCGVGEEKQGNCWGWNQQGQVDIVDSSWSTVATGGQHSCGIEVSGNISCWGQNSSNQLDSPLDHIND